MDTPLCYLMHSDHDDISSDADIVIELLKSPRTEVNKVKCSKNPLLTAFLYQYLGDLSLETTLQITQLFIERGSLITDKDLELTQNYPEIHKLLQEAKENQ